MPDLFPRTKVENISLPRMLMGTNWMLGWSHTTTSADHMITKRYNNPEPFRAMVEAYLDCGIDAMMAPFTGQQALLDGIKQAEDSVGKHVIKIDTPIIDVSDSKEGRTAAEATIAACAKNGSEICLIHHSSAEQLVSKLKGTMDRLPDYLDMIRQHGMVPGLSAHMPELILYSDRNEYDVQTYGTAIVPARVRKPDDKAAVEGTVRHVSTWITAALRDRKFFSLEEARRAVIEKLEELNSRPFQKKPGNRARAFEEEEKAWMLPLPTVPFEPSTWSHPKVSYDYLISDGKNKYSVPYDLIGEHVDVRLTRNLVEVFFQGARVALHVRLVAAQREPVVKPEHMPEAHRRFLSYNEHDFTEWAASVGPNTLKIVRYFMQKGRAVEQGFKPCASLQRYAKQYGNERLEDACARALELSLQPSLRTISAFCTTPPPKKDSDDSDAKAKVTSHGITRGASYFSKGGKRK